MHICDVCSFVLGFECRQKSWSATSVFFLFHPPIHSLRQDLSLSVAKLAVQMSASHLPVSEHNCRTFEQSPFSILGFNVGAGYLNTGPRDCTGTYPLTHHSLPTNFSLLNYIWIELFLVYLLKMFEVCRKHFTLKSHPSRVVVGISREWSVSAGFTFPLSVPEILCWLRRRNKIRCLSIAPSILENTHLEGRF